MLNELIATWTGGSGVKYDFAIHELPVEVSPNAVGVYIYAKAEQAQWRAVYIGQGRLAERISDAHHQQSCITRMGATHVHVHVHTIDSEKVRRSEENDLLANNAEAYAPTGCNDRQGG